MHKRTIKFEDLDGNELTEDFYFHISQSDLIKLEVTSQGGLQAKLARIVAASDGQAIMDTFEQILKLAYGQRSDDGRRFIQTEEVWLNFRQSNAYDMLFTSLVMDADASAQFINAVVPKKLLEQAEQATEKYELPENKLETIKLPQPKSALGQRVVTFQESLDMNEIERQQLKADLAAGRARLEN